MDVLHDQAYSVITEKRCQICFLFKVSSLVFQRRFRETKTYRF